MLKLNLNSKKIFEKSFQGNKCGYDSLQVDEFLDVIIKDYQEMEHYLKENEQILTNLNENVNLLSNQVTVLSAENTTLKQQLADFKGNSNGNLDNIEYLKKISYLENLLYQNGIKFEK